MKKLLVHFATDRNGGEFRRISRLSRDIDKKFNLTTFEVVFIPLTDIFNIPKLRKVRLGKSLRIIPALLPFRRSILSRKLTYFLIDCILKVITFFTSPDILWGETLNGYRAIRHLKGFKVLDFHGALPEETLFSSNNATLSEEQAMIENESLDNCNAIIMQSEAMLQHLEAKHKKTITDKTIIYNCGVDVDLFDYSKVDIESERMRLGYNSDDIIFIYVGGLHKWQRVQESLDIFNMVKCKNDQCRMLLLVQGETAELLNYCTQNNITDVKILQNITFNEVYKYISISNFAWLLRDDIVLNQVASPTKLGEYLACGQVIITTSVANKWSWIKNLKQHLLIVDINDTDKSSSAIIRYIENERIGDYDVRQIIRNVAIDNLSSKRDYASLDQDVILPNII